MRLLETAAEILADQGPMSLTLERVAERAGISKGGLLYHFESKTALLRALLQESNERFTHTMATIMAKDPEPHGRITRAYLRASFETLDKDSKMFMALFGAAALEPKLLDPMRGAYEQWKLLMEVDGLTPARATMLRFVADGLWSGDWMGLTAISDDLKDEILEECLALTRPG